MTPPRGLASQILIVEDEVLIRVFMSDVLEEAGFQTRQAARADEALELLQAQEFALVVTDIEMPGKMSGLDLAWIVNARWPRTGLILVSGRQLPSSSGMPPKARFVAKPWQAETLLTTIMDALV